MANYEYDAIWFGGGAAGRFGAAFHKALGKAPHSRKGMFGWRVPCLPVCL